MGLSGAEFSAHSAVSLWITILRHLSPHSRIFPRLGLELIAPLDSAPSLINVSCALRPRASSLRSQGDALFQTHENLEHLAMMEVALGSLPGEMIRRAECAPGKRGGEQRAGDMCEEGLKRKHEIFVPYMRLPNPTLTPP